MSEKRMSERDMLSHEASRTESDARLLQDGETKYVIDKDKKSGKKLDRPRLQVERSYTGPEAEKVLSWVKDEEKVSEAFYGVVNSIRHGGNIDEESKSIFEELDKNDLFLEVDLKNQKARLWSKKFNSLYDLFELDSGFMLEDFEKRIPKFKKTGVFKPIPGLLIRRDDNDGISEALSDSDIK